MIEYKLHITRQTLLLAVRSFAIALVGMIALVFMARGITRATDSAVSARNDFATLTKKYGIVDQLTHDNDAFGATIEKLESAAPTMDDLPRVEEYLNAVAAKTMNNAVLHFSSGVTPGGAGALAELPLSIQLAGTQRSFVAFLHALETGPYIISIKNISFTFARAEQSTSPAPDALIAQITASVFIKTNSL